MRTPNTSSKQILKFVITIKIDADIRRAGIYKSKRQFFITKVLKTQSTIRDKII